ncbi:MAG: hypothetical protein HKP28_00965, partial [Winogradskyella sp.]|nr:hypothetical protein [Winogradskyella sp.]
MKKIIILVFGLIWSTTTIAQKYNAADKLYRNFAYLEAAKLYKEALKSSDSTAYLLTRIGDCYYKNSDSKQANFWYSKAAYKYANFNPKFAYKYIQTLRSVGNDDAAEVWLDRFKNYEPLDSLVINSKYTKVKSTSEANPLLKLLNLNANTEFSDFGGYEDASGTFYFSSAVSTDILADQKKDGIYDWNEEPYLKIYQASVSKSYEAATGSDQQEIASDSIN